MQSERGFSLLSSVLIVGALGLFALALQGPVASPDALRSQTAAAAVPSTPALPNCDQQKRVGNSMNKLPPSTSATDVTGRAILQECLSGCRYTVTTRSGKDITPKITATRFSNSLSIGKCQIVVCKPDGTCGAAKDVWTSNKTKADQELKARLAALAVKDVASKEAAQSLLATYLKNGGDKQAYLYALKEQLLETKQQSVDWRTPFKWYDDLTGADSKRFVPGATAIAEGVALEEAKTQFAKEQIETIDLEALEREKTRITAEPPPGKADPTTPGSLKPITLDDIKKRIYGPEQDPNKKDDPNKQQQQPPYQPPPPGLQQQSPQSPGGSPGGSGDKSALMKALEPLLNKLFGNDQQAQQPTCTLTVSPSIVKKGEKVTLSWTTTNVQTASIVGVGAVSPQGGQPITLSPRESTTYTMVVQGQVQQPVMSGQVQQPPTFAGATCVVRVEVTEPDPTKNPKAELSCSPKLADIDQTVTLAFACREAIGAEGEGFETGGKLEGEVTATIDPPEEGRTPTSVGYTLICSGADEKKAQKKCSVRINKTSIVMVANPKSIKSGEVAHVGWTTVGMKACTISSPSLSVFTDEQKNKKNVSGVAKTPALTQDTTFDLSCETKAGGTRSALVTVVVQ